MPISFATHSDYKANISQWITNQDLYDGLHDVLKGAKYLWFHEFEKDPTQGTKLRTIREERSRYTNLQELVESTWISIILKDEVIADEATKAMFGDEINDVDGEGHSLSSFARDAIAPHYIRFGRPCIETSAPAGKAKSRAEELELGIRPTWKVISPLDIKDWQFAPRGVKKYQWFRVEYTADLPRSPTEPQKQATRTKVYSVADGALKISTYELTDKEKNEWQSIDEIVLPAFKEIPVATIFQESWMTGVSELSLRMFNCESALDSQLNSQCFQKMFATAIRDDKAKIVFGETAINFLPEGAVVTVVEPSNPIALAARIEQTVSFIFKVAFNRSHQLAQNSKEAPSAESSQEMKSEQMNLALSAIEDIENLLNKAVRDYAAFKQIKNFKGKVTLSRKLNEKDITSKIAAATAAGANLVKVDTWLKDWLCALVDEMDLPNADKIKQEIDTKDFKDVQSITGVRDQIIKRFGNGEGTRADSATGSGESKAA